ncbi:hypothetical protein JOQ06_014796, partial [Pogonophryne albipinna]
MIHWAGRIEKELEKVLQHVTGTQQMRSAQQTAVLESDGGEEEGRGSAITKGKPIGRLASIISQKGDLFVSPVGNPSDNVTEANPPPCHRSLSNLKLSPRGACKYLAQPLSPVMSARMQLALSLCERRQQKVGLAVSRSLQSHLSSFL